LRLLVVRGPGSFCAYLGVKADHALAGLEELEFPCHCGVTFQAWGAAGTPWETGWYWWGWDYAHFMDAADFTTELPPDAPEEVREALRELSAMRNNRPLMGGFRPKNWTVEEVFEDGLDALFELKTALEANEKLAATLLRK
jgi:hypothetical protein